MSAAYEFCGGTAYFGSQVGVGGPNAPSCSLKAIQESEWRASWRGPLVVHVLCKPQSPEESQDMTALEKELDHFVKQLKQKVTLGYTQADNGAHPGHSF